MKWLFWQMWVLLLLSFLLGAFVTWLVFVKLRKQTGVTAPAVPEAAAAPEAPAVADAADEPEPADDAASAEPARVTAVPHEVVAERPAVPESTGAEPAAEGVDLDTPFMGIPVIRLDAASVDADQVDDDGFDGNADDTVVIDADVAAGRSTNGRTTAAASVAAPYPRGVLPLADGGAPAPGFVVKGEVDPMLYHGPASPAYQQTRADVWFRDEDDAENAGFRPWNWRARVTGGLPKLDANGMPVAGSRVDPADAAALAALIATTTPAAPASDAGQEPTVPSPYGEGSALPGPGGSAPSPEYRIKGNGDSMLYHASDSPYFDRTRPQVWFRTEDDAKRAGFSPWNRRVRQNNRLLAKAASEEGPYPGSAKPDDGGGSPTAEFVVKGSEDTMLYHTPFSPFFDVTVADVWFRSEADAQRAGFAAWHTADTAAPNR